MKNVVTFAAALLLAAAVAQPASAQSPAELVGQAVAAQGGADALRGLKTLVIKGEAKHWEPGQSVRAGGEARFIGNSAFTVTCRHRQPGHPGGLGSRHEIRRGRAAAIQRDRASGATAWSIDAQGTRPMSGIRLASHHREYMRGSPFLLLRALDNPKAVTAIEDQRLGEQSLSGDRVPCRDDALHRPVRPHQQAAGGGAHARRRSHLRRFRLRLVLGDWKSVGGAQLAHALSFRLGGRETQRLTYKEVTANPTIATATFEVPEKFRTAALASANSDVPYQWVLRRMFLGRLLDSDAVYFPPGGGFKLVELAPNVQHVVGGSANNLIVDDEGRHRDLRRAGERRPVALGDRRGEGEISRQADHPSGADPSSHGPHRRHADLCGGGRDRDRAGADQGLFRAGGEGAACGVAGRAAETAAGRDHPRSGRDDDAEGRHHPDQPAQHSEPAFGRHADRACGAARTSSGSPTWSRRAGRSRATAPRWRSAMPCASTTSPTRPSPVAMAPPPSRRRAQAALAAN